MGRIKCWRYVFLPENKAGTNKIGFETGVSGCRFCQIIYFRFLNLPVIFVQFKPKLTLYEEATNCIPGFVINCTIG